jgi:hypothetical protein
MTIGIASEGGGIPLRGPRTTTRPILDASRLQANRGGRDGYRTSYRVTHVRNAPARWEGVAPHERVPSGYEPVGVAGPSRVKAGGGRATSSRVLRERCRPRCSRRRAPPPASRLRSSNRIARTASSCPFAYLAGRCGRFQYRRAVRLGPWADRLNFEGPRVGEADAQVGGEGIDAKQNRRSRRAGGGARGTPARRPRPSESHPGAPFLRTSPPRPRAFTPLRPTATRSG